MTLGEFSFLLGVDPKWLQNVASVLGSPLRYDLRTARRLAVARALSDATGMHIPRAYAVAADVLKRHDGSVRPVPLLGAEGTVVVAVDVYRILAVVNTGLSRLRTHYAPRQRGRPPAAVDPIDAAIAYGLDTTLLEANLRRSPAQRLRQLDAMFDFRRRARRA
jgi:hypothetical protein